MRRRRILGVLVGLVGLAGAPLGVIEVTSSPAGAIPPTIITVDNSGDGAATPTNCAPVPVASQCTLRDAFAAAKSSGADETVNVEIVIPAGVANITLTTGELFYDGGMGGAHSLTLTGHGQTVNQTTANSRVITSTTTGLLTVTGLTITGGNGAGAGAGIFVVGSLTVTNVTISGNTTTTGTDGGGIWAGSSATVTVSNSTISGNVAAVNGGGIVASGAVTVTNSTISGNTAGSKGGGIAGGGVTLVDATVVANTDFMGFGANVWGALNARSLTSFGSVVALPLPQGNVNCSDLLSTTSNGFNFSDDASSAVSCHFNNATDSVGATNNPNLGALANNGGSTQTRLPQSGSPLIDAIPAMSCQADGAAGITTDQRGLPRPSPTGGACDIGAVEVQTAAPTAAVITARFTG